MSRPHAHRSTAPTSPAPTGRRSSTSRRENGIDIPTLCHLDGLSDVGACRLCVVEVAGSAKLLAGLHDRGRRGHGGHDRLASGSPSTGGRSSRCCSSSATTSARCAWPTTTASSRTWPSDLGRRPLRAASRSTRGSAIDASHPLFAIDHNRCILCTRCVRVCDEIEGAHTWDVMGRGHRRARRHRHGHAVGRVADLHQLRQVRPGVPDRRPVREGPIDRRGQQGPPAVPAVPRARSREDARHDASRRSRRSGSTAARAATCRSSTWTSGCSSSPSGPTSSTARSSTSRTTRTSVDVCLVEGAVSPARTTSRKIRMVRERTRTLVVVRRLRRHRQRARRCATRIGARAAAASAPTSRTPTLNRADPDCEVVPGAAADGAARCTAVVPVDVFLPGCPPSADLIYAALDRPARGARRPTRARRAVRPMTDERPWPARSSSTRSPGSRVTPRSPSTSTTPGEVADAHFHVTEFRGFERICEGRPFHEMPSIMARICGICPVSHLIASAKAVRRDPRRASRRPPARDLRRVMNLAQIVQSQRAQLLPPRPRPTCCSASTPTRPARNIFGVAAAAPAAGPRRHRRAPFGQQVIEWLGGKRIHPSWVVPGGVDAPLAADDARPDPRRASPRRMAAIERALAWYNGELVRFEDEAASFGDFPLRVHGLVDRDGSGRPLRRPAARGRRRRDDRSPIGVDPRALRGPTSARRSSRGRTSSRPTGSALGYPDGIYRVGPLARLNRRRPHGHAAGRRGARASSARGSGACPAARSTTTTPG